MVTTIPATLRAFLLPYADYFRALGWRVDCLANGAARDAVCTAHFDKCFDIDWSRNPLSPSNLIKCPQKIRQIAEQEKYDIVHVHTPVASFVTRFALRKIKNKIGTKIIYTAHGFHFYKGGGRIKNFIFKSLEKIAAPWTDHIIVMNNEDFEAAQTFYPALGVIKMNGIGLDLSHYSRAAVKSAENVKPSLGLGEEDKLFLFIAEFNAGKCHFDILRALASLKEKNFHAAFAGTGALMEEMKELAKKLEISERVHFLGFQNDVRPIIAASTATLMPSKREGLPRSVMESMALETPVIGSDIRGNRDLLGDDCGILVPVGDHAAIARAMQFCADDAGEIEEIKRNASQKILHYDIKKLIKEHEKIYEEVVL